MSKRILVLDANPRADSFCAALADTYVQAARAHAEVAYLQLSAMSFDPDLHQGYHAEQPLEPDLESFQQALAKADHLVLVTPLWWGSVPAKCKGLLDRALLPGFAFKYLSAEEDPVPLLAGKTLRLIVTMDAPCDCFETSEQLPLVEQLDTWVFQLCGFEPARATLFGPVIRSTKQQRAEWLSQVRALGVDLC